MRKEIKYVLDKNIFKIFAVCIFFICFFLSDNIYAKGLRFKAVSIKDSKNNEDFL